MSLRDNPELVKAIQETAEYKDAFAIALKIHREAHDPEATNFISCVECRCGFALLLIGNFESGLHNETY